MQLTAAYAEDSRTMPRAAALAARTSMAATARPKAGGAGNQRSVAAAAAAAAADDDDDDGHDDLCERCGSTGELLLCENCPKVYHLGCLDPPLKRVPKGAWFCPSCKPAKPPPAAKAKPTSASPKTAKDVGRARSKDVVPSRKRKGSPAASRRQGEDSAAAHSPKRRASSAATANGTAKPANGTAKPAKPAKPAKRSGSAERGQRSASATPMQAESLTSAANGTVRRALGFDVAKRPSARAGSAKSKTKSSSKRPVDAAAPTTSASSSASSSSKPRAAGKAAAGSGRSKASSSPARSSSSSPTKLVDPPPMRHTPMKTIELGRSLEVFDRRDGRWHKAKVLEVQPEPGSWQRVRVHYIGWNSTFDQWVADTRCVRENGFMEIEAEEAAKQAVLQAQQAEAERARKRAEEIRLELQRGGGSRRSKDESPSAADSPVPAAAAATAEPTRRKPAPVEQGPDSCVNHLNGRTPRGKCMPAATLKESLLTYLDLITAYEVDGRPICLAFQTLPTAEELPEYYKIIKEPVDLDHIAEKIEDDKYESLSDLVADVTLMAANAQKFNMPRSPIWYDAGLLMKHAKMSRRRICLRRKFAGTDILEREARKRMLAEAGGLGGGNGKRRRSTDPAAAFASAAAASSSSAAASSAAACPTEGQLSFDTVHIEQDHLRTALRELYAGRLIRAKARVALNGRPYAMLDSKLLVNDPSNRKCFPTFEQMRDIMNAGGFGGNGWKSISIDGHTIKDLRLILAVGGPAPGAISNDVHIDLSFSMWPTDEEFHAWLGAAKRKWRAQRKARKARKTVAAAKATAAQVAAAETSAADASSEPTPNDASSAAQAGGAAALSGLSLAKAPERYGGGIVVKATPAVRAMHVPLKQDRSGSKTAAKAPKDDEIVIDATASHRIGVHVWDNHGFVATKETCFGCGCAALATDGHPNLQGFVHCGGCLEPYHVFCTDVEPTATGLFEAADLEQWMCGSCRRCVTCRSAYPQDKLLTCKGCAKLCHLGCLDRVQPNLNPATANWRCDDCISCENCGTTTLGPNPSAVWMFDFRLCYDCGQLKLKGNYCPLCSEIYRDDDYDAKMMQCDRCDRWLHARCDGIDDETYEKIADVPDMDYRCPDCRRGGDTMDIVSTVQQLQLDALKSKIGKALAQTRILQCGWYFRVTPTDVSVSYPDFASIVGEFWNFDTLQTNIDKGAYTSEMEFALHFKTMVEKCCLYHQRSESQVYVRDAVALYNQFGKRMQRFFPDFQLPPLSYSVSISDAAASDDRPEAETEPNSEGGMHDGHVEPQSEPQSEPQLEPQEPQTEAPASQDQASAAMDESADHVAVAGSAASAHADGVAGLGSSPAEASAAMACSASTASSIDPAANAQSIVLAAAMAPMESSAPPAPAADDAARASSAPQASTAAASSAPAAAAAAACTAPRPDAPASKPLWRAMLHAPPVYKEFAHLEEFESDADDIEEEEEEDEEADDGGASLGSAQRRSSRARQPRGSRGSSSSSSKEKSAAPASPGADSDDEDCGYGDDDGGEPFELLPATVTEPPPRDRRRCELCPLLGNSADGTAGRLLPMPQAPVGAFVHANCALWSAEVVEGAEGGLVNVQAAIRRSRALKCSVCQGTGATLGCCHPHCKENYHMPCAIQAGAGLLESKQVFCQKHMAEREQARLSSLVIEREVFVEPEEDREQHKHKRTVASKLAGVVSEPKRLRVRVGGLAVHRLGYIISEFAGFHTRTQLFPFGYCATRLFWSSRQPDAGCHYLCEVERSDSGPIFRVTPGDGAPAVAAASADEAWAVAAKPALQARAAAGLPTAESPDGLYMFGLSVPGVLAALEQLPNAARCRLYNFRYHEPSVAERNEPPVNASGCARAEPYASSKLKVVGSTSSRVAAGGASGAHAPTDAGSSAADVASIALGLADSMKYRHSKEVLRQTVRIGVSPIHGRGLFALRPLVKDEFIIEYVGELIRPQLCDKREHYYDSKKIGCYMFRIDDREVVDATMKGNEARFVNHCCEPNCVSRIIMVDGQKKIMIMAMKEIDVGEELTYDYKFPIEENKIPCHCGASNCRGTMN